MAHGFKVAPYNLLTSHALMVQASVVYTHMKGEVFPGIYDVSIARKSKCDSGFSCISFDEFFFKLCTS